MANENAKKAETKMEKTKKAEEKESTVKTVFKKVWNIVVWIILAIWVIIVIIDFFQVKSEKDPKFCWFNETTSNYSDGTVTECTGLGYKVIKYERESFDAYEFGPFWIKDQSANK